MEDAEAKARELMRAVVSERDFEAYERLGFVSVTGRNPRYAYLVYPFRPLVAYDTETGELLAEYCVGFHDDGERLPPADDVLAKWMTLRGAAALAAGAALLEPAVDPRHRDLPQQGEDDDGRGRQRDEHG
jgi:hypothetical protein